MYDKEIKSLVAKSETVAANTDGGTIILGVRENCLKERVKIDEVIGKTSEVGVMNAEVGVMVPEVRVIDLELREKTGEVIGNATEVREKTTEVGEKAGVSDDVKAGSVHENPISVQENLISDHVKPISDDVNRDFEVLMGAYRSDFCENARKVLYAFAENPETDIHSVAKELGFSVKSVWRAIRAMKEVGLLVREGGDKGGKWIVKKIEARK